MQSSATTVPRPTRTQSLTARNRCTISSDRGDVNRSDLVADRSAMPQQLGEESNASLSVTPVTAWFEFVGIFESDDFSPEVINREESVRSLAVRLA